MRFFIEKQNITQNKITLLGDDVAHMKDVLRLKTGDTLTICNGDCTDYTCTIDTITKKEATLNITNKQPNSNEPPLNLTLFQALPKTPKVDIIIQKCVELGITNIVFFESERSVQKLKDQKDITKKLERWQKISKAAAMQSQRGIVPTINYVSNFASTLTVYDPPINSLVAYEDETTTHIKTALTTSLDSTHLGIYIGPEGGFAMHEIEQMKSLSITPVSLGKRILRTETAAIVVTALIMYEMDSTI